MGRAHDDESYARISVAAADEPALARPLMRRRGHGVNQVDRDEAPAR